MNKQLPLAENHITITEHVFREANNATANRSWIKTMKYLSLLAALACAGLFVWLRSTGSSPIILLGEILFLGALLLWLLIFFPRSQSRTRYKSLCKGLSDPPKRIIRFYASHLEATGDQIDRTVIDYDQITGYLTTKNLHIIQLSDGRLLLLSKDGFVHGDFKAILPLFVSKETL